MMPSPGVHVRKALGGSAWLVSERVASLLLNFIVGIFVARYLGPESFGALSYAIAFVALLSTIPYLGFGGVVVQQLVQDRNSQGEIIGTVLGAKFAAAVLAFVLANLLSIIVVDEAETRLLVLLISFSMLFDVSSGARLLFEARTELRGVALVGLIAGIASAAGRVVALAAEAPLWVFALMVTVQSLVAALGFIVITQRGTDPSFRLHFKARRAGELFRKSWPLILSSAAAILYLKIDQFMLGEMLGMESVGTYAVAARISEVWYFIPTAIAATIFPRLVQLKASDPAQYERRIKDSLRYSLWLALAIAVPISLAAPFIIVGLYGEPFREAGLILAIHVWACPAVFMGKVVEKWFVTEDLLKFLIGRQVLSAAVNVGLNLLLIPLYGGAGAAVATLIAYTLAFYLSCFTNPKTALAGKWMTEAVFWPLLRLNSRNPAA
jgi:PST family polysaccharide transporter